MRKILFTIAVLASALLLSVNPLAAQDLTQVFVEGRFGSVHVPGGSFLEIGEGNHFSAGGLFSYRPVMGLEPWHRLTLRLSLDGSGIGGENIASTFRVRERLYLLNFSLGLDAIQTSRFYLTLHGGGAVSRNRYVVQAFSSSGGALGTGGFVDACNLGPDLCQSVWKFLGNWGLEGRWTPKESWTFFFVGADYTRFAGSKNQVVFVTGITF